jgi:hypothetical protein
MDSARDFLGLILLLLIAGPLYFVGCGKLFKWWDKRKKK